MVNTLVIDDMSNFYYRYRGLMILKSSIHFAELRRKIDFGAQLFTCSNWLQPRHVGVGEMIRLVALNYQGETKPMVHPFGLSTALCRMRHYPNRMALQDHIAT